MNTNVSRRCLTKLFLTVACLAVVLIWGGRLSAWESTNEHRFHPANQWLSYDGKRLITIRESTVYLWNVDTSEELRRFQSPTEFVSAAISPDGKRIVIAAAHRGAEIIFGESTRLFDVVSGREIGMFSDGKDWVFDATFSPDGRRLLTALIPRNGSSHEIHLWNIETGKRLFIFPGLYQYIFGAPVTLSTDFSPDGQRIVELTDIGRQVSVWDSTNGKEICRIKRSGEFFTSIQSSPDGLLVLTASSSGIARLWDTKTGRSIREFGKRGGFLSRASFSCDGRKVFTASDDRSIRLWDARTGKEVRRFENPGPVRELLMSQDGEQLIAKWDARAEYPLTGGYGACIWNVNSGKKVMQLTNQAEEIVGFTDADQRFITVKEGKPAGLWDGATGKRLRTMQ